MPRKQSIPSLRRHKPSGRAVVTLSGKDHYGGAWPDADAPAPPEAEAAYGELVARWLASGRKPLVDAITGATHPPAGSQASGLSVGEALLRYLDFAASYYQDADGRPTGELKEFTYALRPVNFLCGRLPAAEFGPLKLKQVRELMVTGYHHPKHGPQPPLARKLINQRVGKIKRAFNWLVSEEVVPAAVAHGLAAVKGLRANRTEARETLPVVPVSLDDFGRTLGHVPPHVRGLLLLMLHTGCRPAEACRMTLAQIDRSGDVWTYRPARHKTAHHGKRRTVMIGPKGQQVLREFIAVRCYRCEAEGRPPVLEERANLCGRCAAEVERDAVHGPWPRVECQAPDSPHFNPRLQREERHAAMRKARKTKVQPSQVDRRKARPARPPAECYHPHALAHAVGVAAEAAGVERWGPNRIRHLHGTEVRRLYGLEAAQVALGHAQANVTEVYAERDEKLAARVARDIG